MFKQGDYIVTLKVKNDASYHNCARNNYCFKQREDRRGIYPVVDLSGSIKNGHDIMSFNKIGNLLDWRYATQFEIDEYERLGKPFDITTITNSETPQYDIY